MKKESNYGIISNIICSAYLRSIFLASLIFSVALPLYVTFVAAPSFTGQLIKGYEEVAFRTASHLADKYFDVRDIQENSHALISLSNEISMIKKDFQLDKIKVYSDNGRVMLSTDSADTGRINDNEYFQNVVAKGNIYSKMVRKNSRTAEGETMKRDIIEIYVPIMRDESFIGSFEIYYDVTGQKMRLDNLMLHSSMVVVSVSMGLFCFVVVMLLIASRTDIRRRKAENDLRCMNESLELRVEGQTEEIRVIQITSIEALAMLAEYYDQETGAHLDRIQKYVHILLTSLENHSRYSDYIRSRPNYVKEVSLASLLHDIGKTAIPKSILTKPGKLTKEEFEMVKKHTEIAGFTLDRANATFLKHFGKDSYLALARDIALCHHEKWNGKGYPYGLKGESIPLSARIVALADVYDALRTDRPYKKSWSHEKAVEEITACRGSHFDPVIVGAFLDKADRFEEISSSTHHESRRMDTLKTFVQEMYGSEEHPMSF